MAGINKRPRFESETIAQWYERTPKAVLFELLRDCEIQNEGDEALGRLHWFMNARERQEILKANRII